MLVPALGGFDECFPTVGSCRLPSWVEGARRVKLPDHGELWAQPPEIAIVTDQEGHSATCTWSGAPERLSDALGKWGDAHWLEPGGTARWGMTWRGTRPVADGGGQLNRSSGDLP